MELYLAYRGKLSNEQISFHYFDYLLRTWKIKRTETNEIARHVIKIVTRTFLRLKFREFKVSECFGIFEKVTLHFNIRQCLSRVIIILILVY